MNGAAKSERLHKLAEELLGCGAPGCVLGQFRTMTEEQAKAINFDTLKIRGWPCVRCGGRGVPRPS